MRYFMLSGICWLMISHVSYSQPTVVITQPDALDQKDIAPYVWVWKDTSKRLTLAEVQRQAFAPIMPSLIKDNQFADVFWLRCQIANRTADTARLVFYGKKQFFIDLFQWHAGQLQAHIKGGTFTSNEVHPNRYNLPFSIMPHDSCQLYIKVTFDTFHDKRKELVLTLSSEKNATQQLQAIFWEQKPLLLLYILTISSMVFGIFYGVLQYFAHKDKAFLYYIAVLCFSILIVFRVAEFNLNIKILPDFIPHLEIWQVLFEVFLGGSYLLFFSSMFDLPHVSPRLYKWLRVILIIYAGVVVLSAVGITLILNQRFVYRYAYSFLGAVSILVMFTTSVIIFSLRSKDNSYRKHIIYGYFFIFLGYLVMFYLNRTRISYSATIYQTPSVYMCMGTIIELIFFMIALSGRSRLLEQEALIKGQSLERRRVASELHNNVNSILASVKASLQVIHPQTPKETRIYDSVIQMVDNASREVRHISHNMLPVELEKEGIAHALQALVIRLNLSGRTLFDLKLSLLPKQLKTEIVFNIYTICLELCQNIQKHTNATYAEIGLEQKEHLLVMYVSDNGQGFDTGTQPEGMGLKNIRHRAQSIGAELRVQSEAGEGTVVYLKCPIA